MLADAEMQISAAGSARLEITCALKREQRLVGGAEIRRSTEQPGDVLGKNIEDLTGGIAPGDAFRIGRKNRQALIPSPRQLALLHQVDLVCELRIFRAISCKELAPLTAGFFPTRANFGGEVLAHRIGNEKLRVLRPAVSAFDRANLVLAQRLAVRRGSVLLVRRCCSRRSRSWDDCSDWRAMPRQWPCPRWWRHPARAVQWWPQHPIQMILGMAWSLAAEPTEV